MNVSIINNVSATLKVNLGEYTILSIQPTVQLNYLDVQTTSKKLVEVKVYQYISDLVINATEIAINNTNIDAVYDNYRRGTQNLGNTAFDTLTNVIAALTNGGKIDKSTQGQDEGFPYLFTQPEETADAKMYFTDLSILFPNEGKYRLVIAVNGIEVIPNNIIEVIKKPKTVADRV